MTPATPSTRSPTLAILLMLSVVFNVCFVLGYLRVQSRWQLAGTPEGRLALVTRHLHLTPAQQERYAQLRAAVQQDAAQFQRAHADTLDRFWSALASDAPDLAQFDVWLEELAAGQVTLRKQQVRRISELMQVLTPEQRRACLELFRYKRPRSLWDE